MIYLVAKYIAVITFTGPFCLGYLIRRTTFGYDVSRTDFENLKNDFLLGLVLFHSLFNLAIEGTLASSLDRIFSTNFMDGYAQIKAVASLLFVPDESRDGANGLVINHTDNLPIPKALFVPPYTVNELQAMQLWDHIENSYVFPIVKHLTIAPLLIQIGYFIVNFFDQSDISNLVKQVSILTNCVVSL